MKNIWIFNHHALTPYVSGTTRHYDFSKELVKRGYKVTIFASSFHFSKYEEFKEYKESYFLEENIDGIDFVWIQTKPYYGNGVDRVVNMLDYMFKVLKIVKKRDDTPDMVLGSTVHMFAVYAAYKTAKRLKVPFVMEVRDIWPQTLIDMGISKWHPFVLLLGYMEKFLYNKADKIITLLPFAYEHMQKFGVDKKDVIWISNGVDISRFKSIRRVRDDDDFLITYTGSIGRANVMHTLLEVAKELNIEYKNIKFKIIGEGVDKKGLIEYKKVHNLSNVEILDAVAKDEIPQILKDSDVLYVGLKDSKLYQFGISLNKIFDYLAAEVPIIFASTAKNNPVDDANAGITILPENRDALKEAILKLYNMGDVEKNKYCEGNINFVENNFSIQFLTNKLEKLINGLVWKKK